MNIKIQDVSSSDEESKALSSDEKAPIEYIFGAVPYGVYASLDDLKTTLQKAAKEEGYELVLGMDR
ncbi:hypothetical protein LTR28_011664 [Elasticomyces elasticus]|nr:hypothetical protein LTR28_011664 [Elasticomyces elasticus]